MLRLRQRTDARRRLYPRIFAVVLVVSFALFVALNYRTSLRARQPPKAVGPNTVVFTTKPPLRNVEKLDSITATTPPMDAMMHHQQHNTGAASDSDSIDAAAARQAVNGTLIVVPVNEGYVPFGLNLLCSLYAVGLARDVDNAPGSGERIVASGVLFIAMDPYARRALRNMKLPVASDPDVPLVTRNATNWQLGSFHRLVCTKLIPVIRLLKLGLTVVLADADIAFRKDPRPFFRRELDVTFTIGSCHKDLPDNVDLAKGDGVAKLNTGFYVARSTPGVVRLLTRAVARCRQAEMTGDQPAINNILRSDRAAAGGGGTGGTKGADYTYGFFDGCLFANGCVFFKHLCANTSILDPRPDIAAGRPFLSKVRSVPLAAAGLPPGHIRRDDPVMVHANFLVGKGEKIKHLKKYDLWDTDCVSRLSAS